MKYLIAFLTTISFSTLSLGQCPNNSCNGAYEFCMNNAVIPFNCNTCEGAMNQTEFWFWVTSSNNSPINFTAGNFGGLAEVASYEQYGPFSSQNCNNIGTPISSQTVNGNFFSVNLTTNDTYLFKVILNCEAAPFDISLFLEGGELICDQEPIDTLDECESCVGSFALIPEKRYLISAWTKEHDAPLDKSSYTNPQIFIDFTLNGGTTTTVGPFQPTGQIIDGWQRIEEEFDVPQFAEELDIRLSSVQGDVYFDDIRILPFDASMKTYVYDPVFMRLAAELDERHYSTQYEYDEQGRLIRIKKETEKGVMTIQETRNNTSK